MSQLVSLMNMTMVKYVGHFLEIRYLGSWTDASKLQHTKWNYWYKIILLKYNIDFAIM